MLNAGKFIFAGGPIKKEEGALSSEQTSETLCEIRICLIKSRKKINFEDEVDPAGQHCGSDSFRGKHKRARVSFPAGKDDVLPPAGRIGTASGSRMDHPGGGFTGKESSDCETDSSQSLAEMSSVNKEEAEQIFGTRIRVPKIVIRRKKKGGGFYSRPAPLDPETGVDNILSEAVPRSVRKSQTNTEKDPYPSADAVSISGYMCSVCRKEFGTRIMLEIHARRCWAKLSGGASPARTLLSKSATNKKTYNPRHDPHQQTFTCNLCNKGFASKQWLIIHQKRIHDVLHTYRCEICGVVFNENQKLFRHVEHVHKVKRFH